MPDIDLRRISPSRLNPRLEFSKAGLDELAGSIRQVGVVEPIVVRPVGEGSYEVVVGERRYRAAHQAGLDRIPAIVVNYTDEEVMQVNLIENVQRENLTAVEKGRMCRNLLERFPEHYPTRSSLARKLGVGESSIGDWLMTTDMPEEVQRRIAPRSERGVVPRGKIDYSTAVQMSRRIREPRRLTEVVAHIAERRVPRRIATQVSREAVREPGRSVEAILQKMVDEAPVSVPFSRVHAEAIVRGEKTQTARKTRDPRIKVGSIVRAQITHYADLEIGSIHRKRLADFNEEDARREGGYTLEEFRQVWEELHGEWNPDEAVYVIRFRLAGEPPGSA